MLENVPQLILQLMYMLHIGKPTQAVIVAFVASLLSGTATTLSYLIERDDEELRPVEYYASLECKRINKQLTARDDSHSIQGLTVKSHKTNRILTKTAPVTVNENSNYNHMTNKENESVLENRGRRQALGIGLSKLFQIQPKNIEIGSTLIHKTGITTHVVHMVYDSEIEMMESELLKGGTQMQVTPNFYTQQLFESLKTEINELFCDHFKLSGNFVLQYNDFVGVKKRNLSMAVNTDKRKILLQKMVTHTQLSLNGPNTKSFEQELRTFLYDGSDAVKLRKEMVVNMMENITRNKIRMDHDDLSITQNNDCVQQFNVTELNTNEMEQQYQEPDLSDTEYNTSKNEEDDNDDATSENGYLLDENANTHNDMDEDIGYSVALEMASMLNAESNESGIALNKDISSLILSEIVEDKE